MTFVSPCETQNISYRGVEDFESLFSALREYMRRGQLTQNALLVTRVQVRGLVANAVRKEYSIQVNREHCEVNASEAWSYADEIITSHAHDFELLQERDFIVALQSSCRALFRRGFRQGRGVDHDVEYLLHEHGMDEITSRTDDELLGYLCGKFPTLNPSQAPRTPSEYLLRRRLMIISARYRMLITQEMATADMDLRHVQDYS